MFKHYYGLRMRPFGPGSQPKGAELVVDFDGKGRYWSVVAYEHPVSPDDEHAFEMDYLGAVRIG